MKRAITYLLLLIGVANAQADVNVSGRVIEKESNEPLTGASVIVKGADGKIKKFASSKSNGSFAQEQDRSIGDVLKSMPGINVEGSGKIQYQGEDINKFYIEGSDLLGGKYGIATNGISHEDENC